MPGSQGVKKSGVPPPPPGPMICRIVCNAVGAVAVVVEVIAVPTSSSGHLSYGLGLAYLL